eukprot:10974_1
MLSIHFLIYTAVMSTFPLGVLTLLVCQILADKYGKHKIIDKVQRFLLYSVYISALLCSCFGYSLHVSKNNPRWCETFGIPPCFALLGGSKAFLYAFFLRRARKANVYNINGKGCALYLFDYIGPIYIVIYWLCYVTFAAILFTGQVTEKQDEEIISYCLFESWRWWFVIFSNTVDVFNCFATLALFLLPLLQSIRRLRINNDNVNQRLSHKFIRTMRWNVVLSFIATMSSVSALVSIPVVKEYIWLFCSGDPFINAVCVYMMMAPNRAFVKHHCCKACNTNGHNRQMTSDSKIEIIEVIEPHPVTRDQAMDRSYNLDQVMIHSRSPMSSISRLSPEPDTNEGVNPVQSPSSCTPPLSVSVCHSNTLPTCKLPSLAVQARYHSY